MARKTGTKNRNYPPLTLDQALRVPTAIQDQASGMDVGRLTLAELLDVTPSSSSFRELVTSSRMYRLTTGGINAEEFSLTELGDRATGGDEVARIAAYKEAVLNIAPYRKFFEAFANKRLPVPQPFHEFLIKSADVPEERAEECAEFILNDAKTAGIIRPVKGSDYVDLSDTTGSKAVYEEDEEFGESTDEEDQKSEESTEGEKAGLTDQPSSTELRESASQGKPKKVFIAHGKNRTPLEQLKKALDQFKVNYAVAVDKPNQGRPISRKVANLMEEECSSGIFMFTADERFVRETEDGQEEVWRPSENVVYELGAASILYDNRIVIFKEKDVNFPSDFSDLGYIEFEKDQLVAELGSLFTELVALDILEVRAKS